MFITNKTISRRTVLKGVGVTMALPLLEAMVPARTIFAQGAGRRRRQEAPLRRDRDGARRGRQHADRRAEAPVVAGGDRQRLRPEPERR